MLQLQQKITEKDKEISRIFFKNIRDNIFAFLSKIIECRLTGCHLCHDGRKSQASEQKP